MTAVIICGPQGGDRRALAYRVRLLPWVSRISVASSLAELPVPSLATEPGTVMLSINLPNNAINIRELLQQSMYRIVLYGPPRPGQIAQAINAGTVGFFRWTPEDTQSADLARNTRRSNITLTIEQSEMLWFVCDGLSDRDIGSALRIPPSMVSSRLRRIYSILGAADRAHAVAIGFRLGYLV